MGRAMPRDTNLCEHIGEGPAPVDGKPEVPCLGATAVLHAAPSGPFEVVPRCLCPVASPGGDTAELRRPLAGLRLSKRGGDLGRTKRASPEAVCRPMPHGTAAEMRARGRCEHKGAKR